MDVVDDKVIVYDLGKKIKFIEGCCYKILIKGESCIVIVCKVVVYGFMWIYVVIVVGMDKVGIELFFMIV